MWKRATRLLPRWVAGLLAVASVDLAAHAQFTVAPGPGGISIAPGPAGPGYPQSGVGPGGGAIAPGPAGQDIPVYRTGPGGAPILVAPDPNRRRRGSHVETTAGCGRGGPCLPENLALTVSSRAAGAPPSADATIDSIGGLFAALRACWSPPAQNEAKAGMQMSVRFSFRRAGDLMGPPFTTFATPGVASETRQAYRRAIDAAMTRCGRLRFTPSFAKAIAGRPISVRYVDDRALVAGEQ